MKIHETDKINIFWGDSTFSINPELDSIAQQSRPLKEKSSLEHILFLHQIHSTTGFIAPEKSDHYQQKSLSGDYWITQEPDLGLAVLTADCLPIVAYDSVKSALGIAHAGWKGSVKNIGTIMLEHMKHAFGSKNENIFIFFGPSAKSCCYEITQEFLAHIEPAGDIKKVVIERSNKLYFDMPLFNQLQLIKAGIKEDSFDLSGNVCTIGNSLYLSHRRNPSNQRRQVSLAVLKS